ncbi:hypothetical protein KY495_05530 [Massilia sp. PAMC28688]|uniref:hypothetical protein n=1 Tax=Massilia sp. PAMC28688 TaxID=2861283 RepID=UPI001C63A936|nr:hypothetical protein [Massilia sp. PAMC28688]QYF94658.1 hypothetical protein KY495_05530 [Massilia sp. PAMC28688]
MKMTNYVRAISLTALCAAVTTLSGCASIVSGTTQVVSVETLAHGARVDGATCTLTNDKGVYFVTTPGTVSVRRAYGDMNIKCEKAGVPTGLASFKSTTKGMVAGNILFGGVIGAGVDVASGAAYDYPVLFQVMMNETVDNALQPQPAGTSPVVTGAMK